MQLSGSTKKPAGNSKFIGIFTFLVRDLCDYYVTVTLNWMQLFLCQISEWLTRVSPFGYMNYLYRTVSIRHRYTHGDKALWTSVDGRNLAINFAVLTPPRRIEWLWETAFCIQIIQAKNRSQDEIACNKGNNVSENNFFISARHRNCKFYCKWIFRLISFNLPEPGETLVKIMPLFRPTYTSIEVYPN